MHQSEDRGQDKEYQTDKANKENGETLGNEGKTEIGDQKSEVRTANTEQTK